MNKIKVTGIHHIALKCQGVEQFNKTLHFYCDILGLPVARSWGEGENSGIMLDTGAGLLEIFANAPDILGMGAIRHMALAVDDVDACIEAVRAAGYTVTMEPTDICIASEPPYPARIAFCIGPVGEELEFFHVK
jgi:glyoxylase I family protein